jgi:arsenate reductase
MDRKRVLFLCTGNSARSQMAEAMLRARAGDRYEVHSAGLAPSHVRPEALAVLREAGIPVDGLRSKGVEEYLGKMHVHFLITVCGQAERDCPRIWPVGGIRIFWPVDDPASVVGSEEERHAAFQRARDELSRHVDAWLAEQEPGE